tara:strand:- start:102 stop:1001 length:900 start_codon:yes stop_codon:yes gene_type:complete
MSCFKTLNFFDITFDKPIIYIIGPTAIGKSKLALELAQQFQADIISADSYQVYKGMDIGTAKASTEDRLLVPHHLIDTHLPTEAYNVTDFIRYCKQHLNPNKRTIICGGNGLFLRSFLYDYHFPKAKSNPEIRDSLMHDYERGNKQDLWNQLHSIDPKTASQIHPNNKHRLIRALEIYHITKHPPSSLKQKKAKPRDDVTILGLTCDRNVVTERIDIRVDMMIKHGLIEEVKTLLEAGYEPSLPALNCIGYKETIHYLNGSISYDEMIHLIKIHTHQFSKRQMTWFKKIDNVFWNVSSK